MGVVPGTVLGPYQVTAQIGAGGMGEVYRATDTNLKRAVAVKVLPASVASDPDRLARFQREAEVLAAFNHPNIAQIYGLERADGISALVMELVEGPTLADRIAEGPIPLDETLPIAQQIAEALEAAHGQGIIHRDLKPANVKVRPDGTVKVLDFGLAKALASDHAAARDGLSNSPTITSPAAMTGVGVLLGTAAYMSPEQARGRAVDKRADIWAFGCVLFEMLAGSRAFAPGDDSVSDVLAAVLKTEPDWNALPASTPPAVQRLLRRCLTKDLRHRLHDIADARLEIRDAQSGGGENTRAGGGGTRLAWSLVAALAAVAFTLAALLVRSAQPPSGPQAVFRSVILPPTGDATLAAIEARTGVPRFVRGLALSPDGGRLALVAPASDGRLVLWIHALDGTGARPLAGTEGASSPFWSPDGRHLAFVADRKLKRIDAAGGPVITLHDGAREYAPGTWNRDNIILFAGNGPVLRISAAGGGASPVTSHDASTEPPHDGAFFLPDGRRFLYAAGVAGGNTRGGTVYVGSLDSTERTMLFDGGFLPAYANGFLLFVRDNTLMAQRFDPDRLELTGEPAPLAEQLLMGGAPSNSGIFSVAESGVLVYQSGLLAKSELVWLDRAGRSLATLSEPRGFSYLQLSPSDRHLAVSVLDDATRNRDLWLYDTTRGARTRLTAEASDDFSGVWSPGGDRVAFAGRRAGDSTLNLYETGTSGVGGERRLLVRNGVEIPSSWSHDGRFLLFQTPSPGADIMIVALGSDAQVSPFAATQFTEGSAQFSPDGRWVAYSSNETGRTEVYVAPFQRPGARVPISTDGGGSPRWRHDGQELFYIRGDNTLMAVALDAGESSVDVGAARALFQARFHGTAFPYDVARDGRFVVNRSVNDATPPPITLVVNWPAALQK